MACGIIYFNQIFIKDLCKCYLNDQLCCAVRGIESLKSNYTAVFEDCGNAIVSGTISGRRCPSIPQEKLKLLKAQLACGVGMLVSCVVYVVIYVFACLGICFGHD